MTKKPTPEQAIALFQLTAQLRGTKWSADTLDSGKGLEMSLESLAETADQIWEYLVNSYCRQP